jgi:hypothetical protein
MRQKEERKWLVKVGRREWEESKRKERKTKRDKDGEERKWRDIVGRREWEEAKEKKKEDKRER